MPFVLEDDAPKGRFVMEDGPPAAVKAGSAINDIPRQLGLTARYGLEGVANAAQIVTEPLRYLTDRLTGSTGKSVPLGVLATQAADAIGLPSPQGANERVIGDATRLMAGAGGMGAAARTATALPGMAGKTAELLSANMGQQVASAAGAGLAGGSSREAGGSPLLQAGAALAGGVAGGMVPGALQSGAQAVQSVFNRLTPQQMDQQISAILNRAGVDYSQIPERIRQSLRAEMAGSLRAGREIDPAAVSRLVDFQTVGATPTRGMVSQNPVQITREMNLAKIGANSSDDRLQGLPMIQNQNNATLINRLNESGAGQAVDNFATGERLIGALGNYADRQRGNISSLYGQARDSAGRSAELDGFAFTNRANQLLQENLAGKLPAQIEEALNNIALGKNPLTVDHAEQLKTVLARIQRTSTDGNERYAMGLIRQALDETPIRPEQINPGNLPAFPGAVPPSTGPAARQAIEAFNRARAANRGFMQELESIPALRDAVNGAAPDRFFARHVLSPNANVRDVEGMRNILQPGRLNPDNLPATAEQIARLPAADSRQALDATKNAIVAHLKQKALGGAADEVGKFSQSAYNKALNDIGERKLALFFSPEEIAQLRAVGRVASYMQSQPVGSAVNNSNSGALVLGRGYDALKGFLDKIPGGQTFLTQPLSNIEIAIRNNQAQNVGAGLLATVPRKPIAQGLLLPGIAGAGTAAGLLAAP